MNSFISHISQNLQWLWAVIDALGTLTIVIFSRQINWKPYIITLVVWPLVSFCLALGYLYLHFDPIKYLDGQLY